MSIGDPESERAGRRFYLLQAVRVGSLAAVMLGIAMARGVAPGPWLLGAALSLGGIIAFFFAPPLLARRFKAHDAQMPDRMEP
ncbi:MAG: hypothetical protein V2J51_11010 [Erythrobacter sp.]|jgi:hypothetical protein|nr:hypothetical protein [Erythrobacter sp.]